MCKHEWMGFGADSQGNYRICRKCNKKIYIKTNGDRIRSMTDEELEEFFLKAGLCIRYFEDCKCDRECYRCRMDWIKRPVTKED